MVSPGKSVEDTIEYITMASTGDGIDFGDITQTEEVIQVVVLHQEDYLPVEDIQVL